MAQTSCNPADYAVKSVKTVALSACVQAYEERRRKKDAEREAAEAAQEAELARAAAARAAKQEAEAAEWMGQISVEEQGQEADEQQEGQVSSWCYVQAQMHVTQWSRALYAI